MKAILKHTVFIYFLNMIFIGGCIPEPTTKLFIKSIKVSEEIRIDWYVYSSISNFAPDYLQINTNHKKPFLESSFVTGIHLRSDSLFISLLENGYKKLDGSMLPGIKVIIDTTGESWNDATSRIGRLKRVGVKIEGPHYIDAYCPKGECYDFDITPRYR